MFLCYGIIISITAYFLINAAYVIGFAPTTGLPVPFISYGGSHTLFNLLAVGIVLSDLKGKNSGQHTELYLLIEQLADMYENCTGEKPPKTVPTYEEDKDKLIFFKIVKSIHPAVYIANDFPITDSAIFEGIRLLK